jgi:Bacterial dipeptidyl-peptidase Sh3 domain
MPIWWSGLRAHDPESGNRFSEKSMREEKTPFDRRVTPSRPDLAARHLQGQVEAARFVDGTLREVRADSAPLRREPARDASLDTEALKGECVTVYETTDEG